MRLAVSPAAAVGYAAGTLVIVCLALLIGLLAATGFLLLEMLVGGLLLGAVALMLPLPALTTFLLVVTFLLQGLATYFLRFQQAAWLPYLLCLLLSLKAIRFPDSRAVATGAMPVWNSAPVVCLLLYFFSLLATTLLNQPPMMQVIIGLKNALPLWVAAVLVYQAASLPKFLDRIWAVLNVAFFLQVPLVLYQHFVIVPSRRDAETTGMDAVVGSFGGLIEAGGANATLVIFTLTVMAYHLALWARSAASLGRVAIYWIVGLGIIVSGEVKAVLIWIPVVLLYVLRRRVLASFGSALISLLMSAVIVAGLFAAYSQLYWTKIAHRSNADLISRMNYFFDTGNVNYRSGEISRGASLALWAQDPAADAPRRLLGYGPGASRVSATGGLGEVARRYAPLSIAATSVALLLWDTGVLGLLSFAGVLASTWWLLRKQAGDARLPTRDRAAADAFGATVLMLLSLMIYNRGLNDEPSIQLLMAIVLGCALFWRQRLPPVRATSRAFSYAT